MLELIQVFIPMYIITQIVTVVYFARQLDIINEKFNALFNLLLEEPEEDIQKYIL